MNPVLSIGLTINFVAMLLHNLIEPTGALNLIFCIVEGFAVGLLAIGLLYGSPKTRPLLERFHAGKLQLLGRGAE